MNKLYNHTINIDYSTIELIKQLEEADHWTFKGGLIFSCNGHGVNIYQIDPDQSGFNEVGFYNTGSFAKDSATEEEFNTSVRNHIDQLMEV